MILGSSRPNPTHLIPTLALLTITHACYAADEAPIAQTPKAAGVINLDGPFIHALLTPMSPLVTSPYVNAAAADNPLQVDQSNKFHGSVIPSVQAAPKKASILAASIGNHAVAKSTNVLAADFAQLNAGAQSTTDAQLNAHRGMEFLVLLQR